jgi:glutaredoxin
MQPEVIVYSTKSCGACDHVKRRLGDQGVGYAVRDVADIIGTELLKVRNSGVRGLPVIELVETGALYGHRQLDEVIAQCR